MKTEKRTVIINFKNSDKITHTAVLSFHDAYKFSNEIASKRKEKPLSRVVRLGDEAGRIEKVW